MPRQFVAVRSPPRLRFKPRTSPVRRRVAGNNSAHIPPTGTQNLVAREGTPVRRADPTQTAVAFREPRGSGGHELSQTNEQHHSRRARHEDRHQSQPTSLRHARGDHFRFVDLDRQARDERWTAAHFRACGRSVRIRGKARQVTVDPRRASRRSSHAAPGHLTEVRRGPSGEGTPEGRDPRPCARFGRHVTAQANQSATWSLRNRHRPRFPGLRGEASS
jgi:hypothetical protein